MKLPLLRKAHQVRSKRMQWLAQDLHTPILKNIGYL